MALNTADIATLTELVTAKVASARKDDTVTDEQMAHLYQLDAKLKKEAAPKSTRATTGKSTGTSKKAEKNPPPAS